MGSGFKMVAARQILLKAPNHKRMLRLLPVHRMSSKSTFTVSCMETVKVLVGKDQEALLHKNVRSYVFKGPSLSPLRRLWRQMEGIAESAQGAARRKPYLYHDVACPSH